MADILGFCGICGKQTFALAACRVCGSQVCKNCLHESGLCKQCAHGRTFQGAPKGARGMKK